MSAVRKPVPIYRWAIWLTILGAALVVFYGILTPFWMAVRGIAWISERPVFRRGDRAR